MAPVVNGGFVSVSYFILLSGFVLSYNYSGRARAGQMDNVRFWKTRFARIYPVYFLSLLLSVEMLRQEYGAHTHAMFWTGVVLAPLMLQGWIPAIATFLNTPAWTMSAEAAYYAVFPWLARWKKAAGITPLLTRLSLVWLLGILPGTLYMIFNPDGIAHPDRFSYGKWLWAVKYTPYAHFAGFIFGVLLADLDQMIARNNPWRLWMGLGGFAGIYGVLWLGPRAPYAIVHDGLLMPLFACVILGLAGENLLARAMGVRPLVFVGESSYCLYLLHFNFWNILHGSHILVRLGLMRFDPWISYAILVALGILALYVVEKPAQRWMRAWMGVADAKRPVPVTAP